MPTDKPYRVTVRIQQHERPSRRVPPAGSVTGQDALAVVIHDADATLTDAELVASSNDGIDLIDTVRSLTMWIAMGVKLSEHAEQNGKEFEKFFYTTVLNVANTILEDPKSVFMAHQVSRLVSATIEKIQEEATVELAKRTSTEGKN